MAAKRRSYRAVVLGASAGGLKALSKILQALRSDFPLPVLAALHIGEDSRDGTAKVLGHRSKLKVADITDGLTIKPGFFHLAPAGYHMLVERNGTLALSIDDRVGFSRPSIDVLIESAADAYRNELVAVILTGANNDGAAGLVATRSRGGVGIVQDPATSEAPTMPAAALEAAGADHVLDLDGIADFLNQLRPVAP